MTLYVDPAGLHELEKATGRHVEDAQLARGYFEKHGDMVWGGQGIINAFNNTHEKINGDVRAFLGRLGNETLPGFSAGVAAARRYYANSDQAAADRMDGTMPAVDPSPARRAVDPIPTGSTATRVRESFADVTEPFVHLTEPPDFNQRMAFEPKWHDMASPAGMIRNAYWAVTWAAWQIGLSDRAYDLYEGVLKPVCGDWAGMAKVGYALERTAHCLLDLSSNLTWAGQCTPSAWSGNAADAAVTTMYTINKALKDAHLAMLQMGKEYSSAAEGAFDFSDTIGSLISEAADAAITGAMAAGLATGSASTGVGAPVAVILGIWFASEVHTVVRACREIIQIVGKLDALTSSLKSSGDQFGRLDGNFPLPTLPAVPALPA
ncbi:hypothetical protein AAH979_03620 [Plantactinospora sp. ZYX-F-223]|uniref:hypothetical protein n=1 Tax=Plantactinospora sp. ZYX-F-223 TaxID=3144103 RepID=UPI0031FD6808